MSDRILDLGTMDRDDTFMLRFTIVAIAFLVAGWAPEPPGPPPPRVEAIPPPPGLFLVWEPGHWDWNGQAYVWVPGSYLPKEHEKHYGPYVPGHWAVQDGRWTWVPARFP